MFHPVDQTVQILVMGAKGSDDRVNTFYYRHLGAPVTESTLNQLLTDFDTKVIPYYRACVSHDMQLLKLVGKYLDAEPVIQLERAYSSVFGGDPNPGLPSQVAARLNRHSATGGRHGKGSIRLPDVPTNATVGDTFTNTYIGKLINLAAALGISLVADGTNFAAVTASPETAISYIITNWLIKNIVSSQDSRTAGIGG